MLDALKRVKENKGAPGVDGMTVEQLPDYLRQSWPLIRDQLLQNTYRPLPVRRVEIPKPAGGTRTLGIPSVLDRLIQQAIAQVLTPVFDPLFSPCSFGFRPGRRGHDAVRQAVQYVNEGSNWVVDLDLEKFFDRVNHDKLMARIARRVADKRLLTLIRRYLNSGVLLNGVVICSEEGTPQGGPLSPLLSNVMLDDLDRELERRGLRFVRYADDANIYVRSQRAGLRVKASITQFLTDRLSLKVNEAKSAVDRPWRRKFLGFSMYHQRKTVRPRLSPQALRRVRERIRALTSRSRSQPMARRIETLNQFLRGWLGYYALADARHSLMALDGWIRRRLRMCLWKQWKRAITRYRNLRQHGLSEHLAWEGAGSKRSSWRLSKSPPLHAALGTPYWVRQGLFSLEHGYQKLRQA
ncbi:MAG: group II intron reverse transcriptase/maturase [Terriglobia bacterium]